MTNPSSGAMRPKGWPPPPRPIVFHDEMPVVDPASEYAQRLAKWLTDLYAYGSGRPLCGGQALPDPPCDQPAKGMHPCSRGPGPHQVHVCVCGVTWNHEGLTYAEFRARQDLAGGSHG